MTINPKKSAAIKIQASGMYGKTGETIDAEIVSAVNNQITRIGNGGGGDEDENSLKDRNVINKLIGRLIHIELGNGTRIMGRVINVGPFHIETDFGTIVIRYIAYMRILSEHQRPFKPFQ